MRLTVSSILILLWRNEEANSFPTIATKAAFIPMQFLYKPAVRHYVPDRFSQLQSSTTTNDDTESSETELKAQVEVEVVESGPKKLTNEEKEKVGNLVADDEWSGLTMELTELVRTAIVEDIKSQARDFLGKDEYKIGDFSKQLDSRVKSEVAKLRGKDEYELGDLSLALDTISKDLTCELTGKDDYEFGDLSKEIDSRIKSSVAEFCGKDEYEAGDLTREIDKRAKDFVAEFTSKDEYEFGGK